jgi:small subunit ribosomal protein S2
LCSFPIPANDDSIRTIQLLISEIVNAIISVGKSEEAKIEDISDESKDLNDNSNDEVKGAS